MISILVPIYNVESYLQRCIDSVLAQDFTDWEMILVDDGSPDKCPQICDEAARKDDRIKVVHKKNGGLPSARLAGFQQAKGDFLVFLDADDWLLPEALRILYGAIVADGGYDVVKSVVKRVDDEGNEWMEHYGKETGVIEGEGRFLRALQGDSISPYLHSAIYRASLFTEKVFLPLMENRISVGEDWFVNYYIAPKVRRLKFIDVPTFAYFINRSSMMGGSVYGWSYYDRIERVKKQINQEIGVVEDEIYQTSKALMDLRYFFFPEVPFSWNHFRKIQPLALRGLALQTQEESCFYNPKHTRFLSCAWMYYLYTHIFRMLFYVIKLHGCSRKIID